MPTPKRTTKRTPARRTAAKRTPARRTAAKRTAARRTTKRTPARRTTKRASAARSSQRARRDHPGVTRLDKSLSAAGDAVSTLRKDAGKGARDVLRDVERLLKNARSEGRKLGKAMRADLADVQKAARSRSAAKPRATAKKRPARRKAATTKRRPARRTTRSARTTRRRS